MTHPYTDSTHSFTQESDFNHVNYTFNSYLYDLLLEITEALRLKLLKLNKLNNQFIWEGIYIYTATEILIRLPSSASNGT